MPGPLRAPGGAIGKLRIVKGRGADAPAGAIPPGLLSKLRQLRFARNKKSRTCGICDISFPHFPVDARKSPS